MTILIKQARIVDPLSPFNGTITDIFIENGLIRKIARHITEKADQEIKVDGLHVSPGWVDIFSNFGDPGQEFKETLSSGARAASAGGYTDVFLIPNTTPTIHNKSGVEYIVQKSHTLPVNIYPIGAVTKNTEGKELAEMYDMESSGAKAFSDGTLSIQSAGMLVKALQYVKAFEGTIIQLPDDNSINAYGAMNEGIVSTQLGLPGKPAMAEELVVARDISLAAYAESRIHFTGISTSKSVQQVVDGKKYAMITCSVTPYHLFFCDEDLSGYDTNLKVNPPLRTRNDMLALREALLNGSVDCVATHHLPHEYDSKVVEFEYAKYGMIGLETSYSVLNTCLPNVSQQRLVDVLCHQPRKIFGLATVSIAENAAASLTLFNPDTPWTVHTNDLQSTSRNSPYIGKELKGRVIGTINKDKVFLNQLN